MADFAAIINKTLDKMGQTTPQMRAIVYEKARQTVRRQIDAMPKRPPQAAIDRQFERLEEAVAAAEARYGADEVAAAEPPPIIAPSAPASFDPPVEDEPVTPPLITTQAPDPVLPDAVPSEPAVPMDAPSEPDTPSPVGPTADANRDPLLDFLNEQSAAMSSADASNASKPEAEFPPDRAADMLFGDDTDDRSAGLAPQADNDLRTMPDEAVGPVPPVRDLDDATADPNTAAVSPGPRYGRLAMIVALILLFGAGGYFAYAHRGAITDFAGQFGFGQTDGDLPVRTVETVPVTENGTDDEGDDQAPTEIVDAGGTTEDVEKFTQRLTPEGQEVDEGPATVPAGTGEGTSVAGQSAGADEAPIGQAAEQDAAGQDAGDAVPVAVGQRTILYEERTGAEAGTANQGSTVWSVVQDTPADGLPLEPAIRAQSTIPELGLGMEMTIRRNADPTFPASHIIELFFTVPDTFAGRGVADVQRITFKGTEQDPGSALIAVPAPIDTNIFLIALTDAPTAVEANTAMMRNQGWIDIPMQYVSGRRALITLEKGAAGDRVFNEVFDAWGNIAEAPEDAAE